MKCKLNRGCNLKVCNKRQWCRYEPWNIPRAEAFGNARTKRRMAQISDQTRLTRREGICVLRRGL